MDFDDAAQNELAGEEIGSDELLSDDNLRLPESANMLVRLHAVRAWFARRHDETTIELGEAAIELQQAMQNASEERRPRRRERLSADLSAKTRLIRAEQALAQAQQRLSAYEEAQSLLEDCVTHTSGERSLVEYYLTLEELLMEKGTRAVHAPPPHIRTSPVPTRVIKRSPRLDALADVLHRIEHVGTPNEE